MEKNLRRVIWGTHQGPHERSIDPVFSDCHRPRPLSRGSGHLSTFPREREGMAGFEKGKKEPPCKTWALVSAVVLHHMSYLTLLAPCLGRGLPPPENNLGRVLFPAWGPPSVSS